MTVMERIRAAFGAQRLSLTEQYDLMVEAVASDKEYDPAAAADVLMALNKADGHLQADAERLRCRREDAELIRQAREAKRELQRLESEQASLVIARNIELQKVHDAFNPKFGVIQGKQIELGNVANADTLAVRRLQESANPAINTTIKVLAEKRAAVTRAIHLIDENLVESDRCIEVETRNVAADLGPPSDQQAKERLAAYQKRKQERLGGLDIQASESAQSS